MLLAHQAWRDNEIAAARTLLAGTREDLRGWEHQYINRLCHSDLVAFAGHTQTGWSASFSPDGRRVVTGSWDNTARVWDTTPINREFLPKAVAPAPRVR